MRARLIGSLSLAVVLSACVLPTIPLVNKPTAPPTAVAAPAAAAATPIGQAAIYGRQFVIAADAAVAGLDQSMTVKLLPPSIGVPILSALVKVGTEAVQLGKVLKAIDTAQDPTGRTDAIARAQQSVRTMQLLIAESVVPIQDPAHRALVGSVLSTLNALLQDFGVTLLHWAGGVTSTVPEGLLHAA